MTKSTESSWHSPLEWHFDEIDLERFIAALEQSLQNYRLLAIEEQVELVDESPPTDSRKRYERSGSWHKPLPEAPSSQELELMMQSVLTSPNLATLLPTLAGDLMVAELRAHGRTASAGYDRWQQRLDRVALTAVRLGILTPDLTIGEDALETSYWQWLEDHHGKIGMAIILTQLLNLDPVVFSDRLSFSVSYREKLPFASLAPDIFPIEVVLRPHTTASAVKPVRLTLTQTLDGLRVDQNPNDSLSAFPEWENMVETSHSTRILLQPELSITLVCPLDHPTHQTTEAMAEPQLTAALRFYPIQGSEPPVESLAFERIFSGELAAKHVSLVLRVMQLLHPVLAEP